MAQMPHENTRRAAGLARWIVALAVVLVVIVVAWKFSRPQVVGTVGILGAPPEAAEPLLARDGISAGDTQKLLRFSDGTQLIAEVDTLLDLGGYRRGSLGVRQGRVFLAAEKPGSPLNVESPNLRFKLTGGRVTLSVDAATTTLDVFAGTVDLAQGRQVCPGLSVIADRAGLTPTLRDHSEKIDWIGRLLSDPERVRPNVADTNLPGIVSGMVIDANTWKPVGEAEVRAIPLMSELTPALPVVADADGRFAYSSRYARDAWFLARKGAWRSQQSGNYTEASPTVGPTGPNHPLMQLRPFEPYRLTILDEKKKPVTDAQVKITGDGLNQGDTRTVSMGERNVFEFDAWPDYPIYIAVSKQGYSSAYTTFNAADPEGATDYKEVTLNFIPPPDTQGNPSVSPPVIKMEQGGGGPDVGKEAERESK